MGKPPHKLTLNPEPFPPSHLILLEDGDERF